MITISTSTKHDKYFNFNKTLYTFQFKHIQLSSLVKHIYIKNKAFYLDYHCIKSTKFVRGLNTIYNPTRTPKL